MGLNLNALVEVTHVSAHYGARQRAASVSMDRVFERRQQLEERLSAHFARLEHRCRLRGEVTEGRSSLVFRDGAFNTVITTEFERSGAARMLAFMTEEASGAVGATFSPREWRQIVGVLEKLATALACRREGSAELALIYVTWVVESLVQP